MNAPIKINTERGSAKLVIIILASVGAIIVLALIAILLFTPNLTKVRKAELETAAIATIRKINASQINYSSSFENVGFAPDLASLGPGPDGKCDAGPNPAHACLIDGVLGNRACAGEIGCGVNHYVFVLRGICSNGKCTDYLITASPFTADDGSRNFCSTSDNVIHFEALEHGTRAFSTRSCQDSPTLP